MYKRQVYKSGKAGPVIAYLCEYDALPEVGHGCGHNLIAATSIAAGAVSYTHLQLLEPLFRSIIRLMKTDTNEEDSYEYSNHFCRWQRGTHG